MERFSGGVDFKNVTFAYPSRPNVPVSVFKGALSHPIVKQIPFSN